MISRQCKIKNRFVVFFGFSKLFLKYIPLCETTLRVFCSYSLKKYKNKSLKLEIDKEQRIGKKSSSLLLIMFQVNME